MKEVIRNLLLQRINEEYKILSRNKEWKKYNEEYQEKQKILLQKVSEEEAKIFEELIENIFSMINIELIFAYEIGASDALEIKNDMKYKKSIKQYLKED